jgi:amino acid adenylation domain-containing protein
MQQCFYPDDTITTILSRHAAQFPEDVAIRFLRDADGAEESLTYKGLRERALGIARELCRHAAPGDRALLLLPSGLDYVVAFFGCLYAGVIAVPAYPPEAQQSQHWRRLISIAGDARPRLVLTLSATRSTLADFAASLSESGSTEIIAVDEPTSTNTEPSPRLADRDGVAFLQYTSGSTASPKGVMVSHANILANEEAIWRGFDFHDRDSAVSWLPLFHDMGLIAGLLLPILWRLPLVLMSPRRFVERPIRWLEAISTYGATFSGGPDFAYRLCVERIAKPSIENIDLSRWRIAACGSEPIRPTTVSAFIEKFAVAGLRATSFHPCYGLAEATLLVSTKRPGAVAEVVSFDRGCGSEGDHAAERRETSVLVACGVPDPDHEVRILDAMADKDVVDGNPGEIWVAGASVAQGYWQNTTATEATFVERDGKRYLRTGDLGIRRDGELFIAGRLKDLIIVRGQNLFPQDLEQTIEQELEIVRKGRVIAFPVQSEGIEAIGIAFEISRRMQKLIDVDAVARSVCECLSETYQEGAALILMLQPGALPMTSSGKLQRSACLPRFREKSLDLFAAWQREKLPDLVEGHAIGETDTIEVETREGLARIWSDLFGLPHVSEDANFFLLGGNSLRAVQTTARIAEIWSITVPVQLLFEKPDFSDLVRGVADLRRRQSVMPSDGLVGSAETAQGPKRSPLSFAQARLWFLWQMDPASAAYNLPLSMRLVGPLDLAAFRQAFEALQQRHESLRTRFEQTDDVAVQIVEPTAGLDFKTKDLSSLTDADRGEHVRHLKQQEAQQPFDLGKEPPLRLLLVKMAEDEHLLVLTVHHIIADGWSLNVFLNDLAALYTSLRHGEVPFLAPLAAQYADYAEWQRRWLESGEAAAQLSFWQQALGESHDPLALAFDRPRPDMQTSRGGTVDIRLDSELTMHVRQLAQANAATPFMVLLAVFFLLLSRYSGESDLRVGVPVANRRQRQTEPLIGFFVNTLVLRCELDRAADFLSLLRKVKAASLAAQSHQDFPFEKLVEVLQPERTLAHNPLFQVKFNYGPSHPPVVACGDLRIAQITAETTGAHFDLALDLAEAGEEIEGFFTYARDLFDGESIDEWRDEFVSLLRASCEAPQRRLSELLSTQKSALDKNIVPFAKRDILQLRTHLAKDESLALCSGDTSCSQARLEARSNQLAHLLRERGVVRETRVALVMERSVDWAIGLLGILKAGGAYVPLDPALPDGRLAELLKESRASLALTAPHLLPRLQGLRSALVVEIFGLEEGVLAAFSTEPPAIDIHPAQAAYLIYTSGSTGRPKGVVVSHGALANYVQAMLHALRLPEAPMALVSSVAADLGHTVLFAALCTGRPLHLLPADIVGDAVRFADYMTRHRIGVLKIVPSHLRALLQAESSSAVLPEHAVILGGEVCSWELVETIRRLDTECRIFNHYGPTETTVGALAFEVGERLGNHASVPIGHVLPNCDVAILDPELGDVAHHVPGELFIGGAGVARGYDNQPGLTAASFVPDPAGDGARLYRTGDRVKCDRDGRVEFIGRIDDQIKIRGYRIEPTEVAAALRRLTEVSDAAVLGIETDGTRQLAAYCVLEAGSTASAEALRAVLADMLPSHMVPATLMVLDRLPLTANGKLDRRALPRFEAPAKVHVAPEGKVEETLALVWQDVLKSGPIGVTDNFFSLGGDSIRSLQVIARARKHGFEITPKQLFESQTIRALAGTLATVDEPVAEPPFPRADRTRPVPLSHAQSRLRFLWEMEPSNPVYNVSGVLRLGGKLDLAKLEQAFAALVMRHEVLRTSFPLGREGYEQRIAPFVTPRIELVTIEQLGPLEREARVETIVAREAKRPFDLENGPVLRLLLLRLAEQEHVLLVNMHHIVSDAWSLNIFMDEVASLYSAALDQKPASLPELPLQYADYAVWQRNWLMEDAGKRQLAYWVGRLADAEAPLVLPADRPRPAKPSYRGDTVPFTLSEGLVDDLKSFAQARKVTLSTLLLTAFEVLLYRYSGERDLRVGLPFAGRRWTDTEHLIGFFVNMLVVRTDLDGDPSFETLLERVSASVLDAQAHQDIPFEQVVEALNPERSLTHNPLFQVTYNHRRRDFTPLRRLAGLEADEPRSANKVTQFDLTFNTEETNDEVRTSITYSLDLFDRQRIETMATHFVTLLRSALDNPAKTIGALSLGTGATTTQTIGHASKQVHGFLHQEFERQAIANPGATAILCGETRLSYDELNRAANRLARRLRGLGVMPESLVGLYLDRRPELVVALLAVLKTGAAYLPLSPDYPLERIQFMLADAAPRVVISASVLAARLGSSEAGTLHVLCLDDEMPESLADDNLCQPISKDNLAYCIYTSGSTGRPKGVAISHGAIANHMAWMSSAFEIDAGDRILQKTAFSFDASVWEFWLPLMIGGTCVLASPDAGRDPSALWDDVRRYRITVLQCVPSFLQALLDHPASRALQQLRYLFCGGEALPQRLIARAQQGWSGEFWNLYGPTEAAIDATSWLCDKNYDVVVPIGTPITNLHAYVLDDDLDPVATGVVGELYIGGDGLARGYLRQPVLTAQRFVPNLIDGSGERLYRTGDLARLRGDGLFEYVGRLDQQVKLRGFRIELEEVAAALVRCEGIRQAVVVPWSAGDTGSHLIGYVVADLDRLKKAHHESQDAGMIRQWESVFENAYASSVSEPNFTGWNSSYTDSPIPEGEMRAWRDATVARIADLRPRRILEIGCGVGLLLQPLAPLCESYCGTDLSARAIADLQNWLVHKTELDNVRLLQCEASQIDQYVSGLYDVVVLNSVVQYFPDGDYLLDVLEAASKHMEDGSIFIGDIRHLALLPVFHASVQFAKAPADLGIGDLRKRIDKAIAMDKELVVDPRFFEIAAQRLGFSAEVSLKRTSDCNELTLYRYDVTLRRHAIESSGVEMDWPHASDGLATIAERLAVDHHARLKIRGIPNRRLCRELALAEHVMTGDATRTVRDLRSDLSRLLPSGEDPNRFWALGEQFGYEVRVGWASDSKIGCFDVEFIGPACETVRVTPRVDERDWKPFITDPLAAHIERSLGASLCDRLAESLPDYMVPSQILVLGALPYGANGKLDRNALPTPDLSERQTEYVAPRGEHESRLARIWQEVLQIERTGVHDNFFELGGHSLLAAQVVSRVRSVCDANLPLRSLFETPTVAGLAEKISELSTASSLDADKVGEFEALFDEMGA